MVNKQNYNYRRLFARSYEFSCLNLNVATDICGQESQRAKLFMLHGWAGCY